MAYRLILQSRRGGKGLRRQYAAARVAGLEASAQHWVEQILKRHFDADAAQRYRYPKRTPAHERRKRREGKSPNPNVYTGRLMAKMLGMQPRITVNARGVTMVWRGLPKYTYVVDTVEWVTRDSRWNDEVLESLRAKGETKAVEGILKWRAAHPQTKDGRFKLVKRPDKPREITAMNREDADAVSKVFRTVFLEKLKEART